MTTRTRLLFKGKGRGLSRRRGGSLRAHVWVLCVTPRCRREHASRGMCDGQVGLKLHKDVRELPSLHKPPQMSVRVRVRAAEHPLTYVLSGSNQPTYLLCVVLTLPLLTLFLSLLD